MTMTDKDLTERAAGEYPTIHRLADLARGTIGYQAPELVAEAVRCYRALLHAESSLATAVGQMQERCAKVANNAYLMAKVMYAGEHMRVAASIEQGIRALPAMQVDRVVQETPDRVTNEC